MIAIVLLLMGLALQLWNVPEWISFLMILPAMLIFNPLRGKS